MKTYKQLILAFSFLLICIPKSYAQENFASNVLTEVSDNEKLLISYDIKTDGARSFSVILLLTADGEKIDASSVYGDVGTNIEPGLEKAIVWYFNNDYDGNINDVQVDVFAYKENEPQAIFKIVSTSNRAYAPSEIKFSNSSSYANEYQWDFDDPESGTNNISFLAEPSHIFTKGGVYSISLTARNTQLDLEDVYYQSVEIKEHDPVVADFEIEGNNQLPPAKVNFINKSVNADVFEWNFGDPSSKKKNTSDKSDPNHKFQNAGTYSVQLIVKNNFSGLKDTATKEVIVKQTMTPVAGFTYSKSTETAPSTVVFKNTSTGSDRFVWNFGDPGSREQNTSDLQDPAHVFGNPGQYKVTLEAYGAGTKKPSTFTETISVSALPNPPRASFTIENNNVLGPATIIFRNSSQNAMQYSWNFGDPGSGNENTSDRENPTHTYQNAGEYTVELTASNPDFVEKSVTRGVVKITAASSSSSVQEAAGANNAATGVSVAGGVTTTTAVPKSEKVKPVANFSIDNEGAIAPAQLSFTSTSLDADKYEWDFGDPGSTSNTATTQNASHTYNKPGRYNVTLKATNTESGETDVFSDFATVVTDETQPIAGFRVENNEMPAPSTVVFTNNSRDADTYEWNFGDEGSASNVASVLNPSHIYEKAGKYMVTLKVTNSSSGLSNLVEQEITVLPKPIQPVAAFSYTEDVLHAPVEVNFINNSSDADIYEWNFGNESADNNTSSEQNPKHKYEKAGDYKVTLRVENSGSGLTHIFSEMVKINPPAIQPIAGFKLQEGEKVAPATLLFENLSTEADNYVWDFGDPLSGDRNRSTEKNPQHLFQNPGEYKVVLTAKNTLSGLTDQVEIPIGITKETIPLVADFEIQQTSENAPVNIAFHNISSGADSYHWNFGDFESDFNTSEIESPNHHYERAGVYEVTLKARNNETGEEKIMTKTVTLKSSAVTFLKSSELTGDFEYAYSVIQAAPNEYMVAISGEKIDGSSIVNIKGNGTISKIKSLDHKIFDLIAKPGSNDFQMLGIDKSGNLFIQGITKGLATGASVVMQESKNFKTDFAVPQLVAGSTGEIGVVANVLDDRYPINVIFQKTNKNGKNANLVDRTFKYVGTKLVTNIIPTEDGGYALTGYWQEKSTVPTEIMFGRIDRHGHGTIDRISSSLNVVGYDIKKSYQGGYAILRGKENELDNKYYELSFTLIDADGGPTDCANLLPCTIRKEEVHKYKPTMRKTESGYVIATHTFNGNDYNIMLIWIDKTGDVMIRYEEIDLPNNQFVMDFVETSDGGFLIAGTELVGKLHKAILLKTDRFGKINL